MAFSIYKKLLDGLANWLIFEPEQTGVMPYDFSRLKHDLKPGDVILIEGRSRVSSVIRSVTQSPWTHAVLYVGRLVDYEDDNLKALIEKHSELSDKTRLILEDLMDRGTALTPLSFYQHHHIRVCRPIGITPGDLNLVLAYALRALGQPYNVRHLIDLFRFLLPWTIFPRRWGSSLFRTTSGEPESGICSTLIAEAYTSVYFPILPFIKSDQGTGMEMFHLNPHLFTPKDFDYSPYFEIIKHPLFNPDEPLPYYRRLPWSKTDFLHQGNGVLHAPIKKKKKRLKIFSRNKDEDTSEDENSSSKNK